MKLSEYFSQIKPWQSNQSPTNILSAKEKEQIVDNLLNKLIEERPEMFFQNIGSDYFEKRGAIRALLNIRSVVPLDNYILSQLNRLLFCETCEKDLVEISKLQPISMLNKKSKLNNLDKLILWQGDITRLKADAIVNAANTELLGCFHPLHNCIDNVIHSAAGPQLREACDKIIKIQGHLEKTGDSKITPAYNLPSKYILHTVGPIVNSKIGVTEKQKQELAQCYLSCLELGSQFADIKTLAFCCISTGVFSFPKQEAAQMAITTVDNWLTGNKNKFDKIIFNVFTDKDYQEYKTLLTSVA